MLHQTTLVRDMSDLAGVLARGRREARLSQRAVDESAGLTSGHTAKIEAGYRALGSQTLPAILAALGVALEVRLVPVEATIDKPDTESN